MTAVSDATPELKAETKHQSAFRLLELSLYGCCLCLHCYAVNSRESDDHGQPDFCARCKSTALKNVAPGEVVDFVDLIEPTDLL